MRTSHPSFNANDTALRRKIVDYYRAGVTVRSLKERFHLSQTTLYRLLREHGVELRKTEGK